MSEIKIKQLPRAVVEDLCRMLGHDLNMVTRITIEPDTVTVEVKHFVAYERETTLFE